jgi:hypothetical protein
MFLFSRILIAARLLIDLDCPEDPAWYYLNTQSQWIKTQLRNSYLEIGQIFPEKKELKAVEMKSKSPDEGGTVDFASNDHIARKFVYTACHIVRERLSSSWKMAKKILEGKFKRVSTFNIRYIKFIDVIFRRNYSRVRLKTAVTRKH